MNRPASKIPGVEFETGNVAPLMHEIRHALARLIEDGEESAIDLQSLPLAPGEEKRIEEALGIGEVRAELDALGPSNIVETRYPGVWLVTHRNADEEVIGRLIEITRIPAVLESQPEDISRGLATLRSELDDQNANA